jgi:protein involved in polysaccharide export with SLBB domain
MRDSHSFDVLERVNPMKALCVAALAGCLVIVPGVAAQGTSEPASSAPSTRPELEASIRGLEALATSAVVADSRRAKAQLDIAAMRTRLTDGDFHPGDRIQIKVARDVALDSASVSGGPSLEEQLSDTFTVGSRQELNLPVMGVVSLRGVLRAELQSYLKTQIVQYVREPIVEAYVLVRLSVQGAVLRPGFYTLHVDAALSDALMAAGGPARGAKIERLRIERGGEPMWEGVELQHAIAEGKTLVEMNMLPGDQLVLPEGRSAAVTVLRFTALVLTIPVMLVAITRD